MTLSEVEILMRELNKHISDHTQLLFGTAVDGRMGNRLSVTVISSLASETDDRPVQNIVPVKSFVPPADPMVRAPEPEIAPAVVHQAPEPEQFVEPEAEIEPEAAAPVIERERVLQVEATPSIQSLVSSDQIVESEMVEVEPERAREPEAAPEPAPRIIPPKKKPIVTHKPAAQQISPKPGTGLEKPKPEKSSAAKQEVLQFEPMTRGRFEKSEPTIVEGQDLDVPTFLRKNVRVK
jgi:cell division protein FtsZ